MLQGQTVLKPNPNAKTVECNLVADLIVFCYNRFLKQNCGAKNAA